MCHQQRGQIGGRDSLGDCDNICEGNFVFRVNFGKFMHRWFQICAQLGSCNVFFLHYTPPKLKYCFFRGSFARLTSQSQAGTLSMYTQPNPPTTPWAILFNKQFKSVSGLDVATHRSEERLTCKAARYEFIRGERKWRNTNSKQAAASNPEKGFGGLGGTLRHHKEHVDVAQECILNVIIAVAYETLDKNRPAILKDEKGE